MRRYFIKFSYFGTQYRGMQKNVIPGADVLMFNPDTIQGALESAFSTLHPRCRIWPRLTCSSRTDAGVHGLCNTAHIDLENTYDTIYKPEEVLKTVNRYFRGCHHEIRLLEVVPVTNDFHTRALAKSRTYFYRFMVSKDLNEHRIPMAEMDRASLIRPQAFDIDRIKRGTQLFMGTKNFTTFSARSHNNDKPIRYVRSLNSLTVEKGHPLMPYDPLSNNFEYWNIICSARSFLYNQVRRITSTLIGLGSGAITEKDINIMLQVPNHKNWRPELHLAPAFGLYLANVEYCPEELEQYIIKYKTSEDGKFAIPLDANLI